MGKSEWTVDTLRDHILSLRAGDRTAIEAALSAADRAVSKAEQAAEKRFEGLNELRKVVSDVVGTLITRAECETRISALSEKTDAAIQGLTKELNAALGRLDKSEGQSGGKAQSWGILVGAVTMAVGITSVLWTVFLRH